MLKINKFRCYVAKIEESEKSWQSLGVEPRVQLLATARFDAQQLLAFFTFPYFRLITSKFIYNYVHINIRTKINYND